MSLGSGHDEPSRVEKGCRAPSTTPVSASLLTDRQDYLSQSDALSVQSQMFSRDHALTTPVAPTILSEPSDADTYRPDRYGARPMNSPDRTTTPEPTPAEELEEEESIPAPLMMAIQADPLVHRDFKDELTRAAGTVTPGVSDAPYIRYAIEAITRRRNDDFASVDASTPFDIDTSYHSPINPQFHSRVSNSHPRPVTHTEDHPSGERQALIDGWQSSETPGHPPERNRANEVVENFNRAKGLLQSKAEAKNLSSPRNAEVWQAQPGSFSRQDIEAMGFHRLPTPPPLTNKPWILRSVSLLLFGTLCLLMIAALVFSAVWSIGRDGFTPYLGRMYDGDYFLFRVLPQLVGAFLVIYAQCIIAAMIRVFPFSSMASDDRRERRNAVFLPLYPKAFLWPHLFGPWNVWVPVLVAWLANFTIPLLSSLYTVDYINGVWIWSTVQGVAWTLVALYVSLLLSTVVLFVYWRHRQTGMIKTWDARSIADVIFLCAQSNSLPQYWGLETAATHRAMKNVLDGTAERLGYWTTPEFADNAIFWSMGVPTADDEFEGKWGNKKNLAARRDGSRAIVYEDIEDQNQPGSARFRYLPWCFRSLQVCTFTGVGALLLIALFIVSFLPATDIRNGFLPGVTARPEPGAFSPADFLYSFLPSLLGLALYLAFQSLDLTLRILAPWGELAREEGSRAEKSILLDYAACLPWEATYKAIRHHHWRVAFVTFLSPLFILIPVLSGGLFMAFTPPTGAIRMYPDVPLYGVVLALLVLYVLALISLIPSRAQYRLPHAVTCLADILSFCSSESLRTDEAFDQEKISRRNELEGALDCGKDWHRQGRWTFGNGKNDEDRIGIRRYSKFTVSPRSLRRYDEFVRGKTISGPLLHGSGPLFGH